MDTKEIQGKVAALGKAASQNDAAAIASMLRELQKGVRPTEDLLRSTRVGIVVNKFKQHRSPDIARLAGDIVAKWRTEVKQRGATPATGGATAAAAAAAAAATPGAAATAATPATAAAAAVAADKRSWKTDGVDTKQTGNGVRDGCIGLLYDGLCHNTTTAASTVLGTASAVEAAAYAALGPETREQYRSKIRSLFQNLKSKSNPKLRERVLGGEVTPEQFVRMSHTELKSAEQREQERRIHKENMDRAMVAQAERSISSSLQCGKCGQRKVTYTEAQTRSADEPMTLFCTCMNCGKSWRQ